MTKRSKISRWLVGVVLAMLALGMGGCHTDKATLALMAEAESVAKSEPQRARELLHEIDRDALHTEYDRAHYALIASEIYYYNFEDSDRDTLSRPMADYYVHSEAHGERARALYQHSLILINMSRNAEAMMLLNEAATSAAEAADLRTEGLIHRTKGDIYGFGCLFNNALDEYALARLCFEQASLDYHAASIDYDTGVTQMLMRDYDAGEESLLRALEYAYDADNRGFAAAVMHELCDLYIYEDRYADCRALLANFDERNIEIRDAVRYYAAMAIVAAEAHDVESAEEYLAMAAEHAEGEDEAVEYAQYLVARMRGDMAEALRWQERSKQRQDRVVLESLAQPVLNVEVDLLQKSLDAERRTRELTRQRNTVIYLAIALIVLFATLYIRARIRRKNRDIAHYVETIRELQLADRGLPEQMNATISSLYRDRFSELNNLCDIYYDHSGSARQKNLVFERLKETIEAIKMDARRLHDLEEAVNLYRNDLMRRLREQMPRLSERDLRVALYVFAGFSNRAIAIFIESDPTSVSKLRYNIKQKIKSAAVEDGEEFMAALSDK